jgi:hypothetical protein
MLFSLPVSTGLIIIMIAFFSEYIDSTLGMGYGTALAPVLLLFGFQPLEVVPAVLLSEFVTGLLAGVVHNAAGNVDFKPKTINIARIVNAFKRHGVVESFRRGVPLHLKVALLIAACSIAGTLTAVLVALSLPAFYLKLYIGVLVLLIGVVIIATINREFGFSWKKVVFLGLVASFNKGMSGGGYGPVVTGGQIIAGVNGKNAIGITSLAEGLTCFVGIAAYYVSPAEVSWRLAPYLLIGAVLSVPLSAFSVKVIRAEHLRYIIGAVTVGLGAMTIVKLVT